MWKLAALVVLAACASGAAVSQAAYVIKLKNGNEYVTTRYWHEGSQVLFDAYDGVFGIDKAFVGTIEKTDRVVKVATVADQDPSEKNDTISKENSKEVAGQAPGKETTQPIRDENDPIMKEFNEINALSQNLDGMLTSELFDLSNRLTGLKKKLQLEGKTNDYIREFGAIHDMGNAVETVLKTRR